MRTDARWLCCSGLIACGTPYLVKVNDQVITASDLREEFKRRHGGHERLLAGEPEVRSFLDKLVDRALLVEEAYRLGLDESPQVQATADALAASLGLEHFARVEIEQKAEVADAEVRDVYERELVELTEVRQLVTTTREAAEAARARIALGADFEALARELSTAPTRTHGGRLVVGWGMREPEWEQVVAALAPGEVSAVLTTPHGFEVVRLEERRRVERPELAKAAEKIRAILERRKLEARQREVSRYLWQKYGARQVVADLAPDALGRTSPETPLVTWRGGVLAAAALTAVLDLGALAALPAESARQLVERRLREAVNSALAMLEARARGYADLPEVAARIRRGREDRMYRELLEDYVLRDVAVTDEEVKRYFEEHAAEMVSPERRHVAHIVLASAEEAASTAAEIAAGESFVELAAALSKDAQTARAGGDLGWVERKDVPPGFDAVFAIGEGEVTPPIESRFGVHLFKVIAIAPERPLALAAVEAELEKKLLRRKADEARGRWLQRLRASAAISIDEQAVRELSCEDAPQPPPRH